MKILIIKLGATGDVVRTTPLIRRFNGDIAWLTTARNRCLLEGIAPNLTAYSWDERDLLRDNTYDLIINLEDEVEIGDFVSNLRFGRIFGASLDRDSRMMRYSDDAACWFDLGLISVHGREVADRLKFLNRRTYQEMIFSGLGMEFRGEEYVLPPSNANGLIGDVAIAPVAGPVWPMKAWAFYDALQIELEKMGFSVNVLPSRASLLEHLADIRGHRCLVSGDSLPMHFALGSGIRCVSIFNCTSPWEIYEYGRQLKIVSPILEQCFYRRGMKREATTAVPLKQVLDAVVLQLCTK